MGNQTPTPWRKSKRSQDNGGCVEARMAPEGPQLSDSKLPDNRPIITLDEATYRAFIEHIKSGSLSPND